MKIRVFGSNEEVTLNTGDEIEVIYEDSHDDDLVQWMEEREEDDDRYSDPLVVTAFEEESALVWIANCPYAISLGICFKANR